MKVDGGKSNFPVQNLGEHKVEYQQYDQAIQGQQLQQPQGQPQQLEGLGQFQQDIMQDAFERFNQMVEAVDQFLGFTNEMVQGVADAPTSIAEQLIGLGGEQLLEQLQDVLPPQGQELLQQGVEQLQGQAGEIMQQIGELLPQGAQDLIQEFQGFQQQVQELDRLAQMGPRELLREAIKDTVHDVLDPYKQGGGHVENAHHGRTWGNLDMPQHLHNLGAARNKGQTLLEGEARFARFGELDEQWGGDWGTAYANGHTDFLNAQGRVFGDAGWKGDAFEAYIGAEGRAELLGAHYNFGYATPTVNIAGHEIGITADVQADAFIGAQGYGEAMIRLGKDPRVHVGGEAFVGASATIQGQAALGDMAEIHGSATGWAGAGIKGDLDIGFEDGKLNFDMGFGAALGLGFELDWGFSVDVGAVGDFVADVGETVLDGLGDIGEGVAGFAEDVADGIGDAVDAVGDAVGDAADAVGDFVGDVGDAVGDFFSGW